MKDKAIAYLCWCGAFFGICGLQRFYVGKNATGWLWLFTFGLLGIGQFIDLFTVGSQVETYNLKASAIAGRQLIGSIDVGEIRTAIQKLDRLYVADLVSDDEYTERKRILLQAVAESIYDANPEDGLLAGSQLVEEGLLSDDEFQRLKTAVL